MGNKLVNIWVKKNTVGFGSYNHGWVFTGYNYFAKEKKNVKFC